MSKEELSQLIDEIRGQWKAKVEELRRLADKAVADCEAEVQATIRAAGRMPCDRCEATGAVERLDSATMLKFGLRPWDGCGKCDGGGVARGYGFI